MTLNNVESIQHTFSLPALTMNIDINKIAGANGMDNYCVLSLKSIKASMVMYTIHVVFITTNCSKATSDQAFGYPLTGDEDLLTAAVDELTALYELTAGDLASGGSLIAGNYGISALKYGNLHLEYRNSLLQYDILLD